MANFPISSRRIITKVTVWSRESELMSTVNAIWDTGAKTSSISFVLAQDLCLSIVPNSKVRVNTIAGPMISDLYKGVLLFGDSELDTHFIASDKLSDDISVIIGMDVITQGDFSISNASGTSEFIFRMPSKGHVGT